jgi:hypothetical protein
MATLRLKHFTSEPLIASDGNQYLQLTGLGEDGAIYVYTANQKWQAISMELVSVEERAAASGIKVVN